MTTTNFQICEREKGDLLRALRTLAADHERRADEAMTTATDLRAAGHQNEAIALKSAANNRELRGRALALIDRLDALFD